MRRVARTIGIQDLGGYFLGRTSKSQLKRQIRRWASDLANTDREPLQPITPDLEFYIDKYSEQVTAHAEDDLIKYFVSLQNQGFTFGGLPTDLPPLSIAPGNIKPSNTAIACVAEGLAGWYLETQGLVPLARPIGEGPDLMFESSGSYILVQVKGTQEEDVLGPLVAGTYDLLDHVRSVAQWQPDNRYHCWTIGTVIGRTLDYGLLVLQVEVTP